MVWCLIEQMCGELFIRGKEKGVWLLCITMEREGETGIALDILKLSTIIVFWKLRTNYSASWNHLSNGTFAICSKSDRCIEVSRF